MADPCLSHSREVPLSRRLLAEALGTGLLVTVVVGSGVAAARLSPDDVGLQALLENSTATVFGLAVLILVFSPVSGAHLNPLVSAGDWLLDTANKRTTGTPGSRLWCGPDRRWHRGCGAGERCSTCPLARSPPPTGSASAMESGRFWPPPVWYCDLALARTGQPPCPPLRSAPILVRSLVHHRTSFANPAVTAGRIFSDTFAGIAPGSALFFVAAPGGCGDRPGPGENSVPRCARDRGRVALSSPIPGPTHRGELIMAKPSVLFVCVHNAGRSQMAAAS